TPIQLAAERLQRRFGKEISSDPGIFGQLTETIIRQVGDLRRMVDEFSSFARIPKPVFRQEHLNEMARQALFLHEVAHPQIHFNLQAPDAPIMLVCDRRQLSQALINIIKNGVEAIVEKQGAEGVGEISMTLAEPDSNHVMIRISDTGVGLPPDRARLNEPYVTTRANGTGLGLAIVDKIIEDHQGSMTLADRPGGGTVVTLKFERLAMPAAHTAAFAESEL
ncbi:MAG: GHKL domain-containing protein, partial [Alphaproteobacteria bacterium]|nr:GHKL domain-containing protein [Alphaproteobacteria bacterium]